MDVIKEAIAALREVSASAAFQEAMQLREKARREEEQILNQARLEEREKWQPVIEEKKATIAEQAAQIAELKTQLGKNG